MKKFSANDKYYTQDVKGYSAKDEFDLQTRVHITNELPPIDLFDMIHSSMKNDYWRWFVGDSFISHDVQYNEFTNGLESINKFGELEQYSIAKYVNGLRCVDYGPTPIMEWVPKHKELVDDSVVEVEGHYEPNYEEKYLRYELNGVLMPEFDLLIHEGYRYLNNLYPDHPNWMKLLTLNEFNDEISQAAYLIDYKEDNNFIDWLSYYFTSDDENEDEVARQEAASMKIRNLKHNSFRRKFYGSKTGSRMLGNDIFQHISSYPLAEYIPIEPFERPDNFESVDNKWFVGFEKQPSSYTNRKIDLDNPLLHRQFRLQDVTSDSQDFLERYKEPPKFFGTAYPTPLSLFDLYEYQLERVDDKNELTYLTMAKDFRPGQQVKFNGQPSWERYLDGHITEIYPEDAYKTKVILKHRDEELDLRNSKIETSVKENALNHVSVDVSLNPIYTELEIYPSNKSLITKLIDYNNLEETIENEERFDYEEFLQDYFVELSKSEKVFGSTKKLHEILYSQKDKLNLEDPRTGLFTIDPHQDGCFYMVPQQFLTTFEENLNIQLNTEQWNPENPYLDENENEVNPESSLEINPTVMSTAGIVRKDDVLMYDKEDKHFSSKVLDISGSFVQFTLNGPAKNKRALDTFKRELENKENPEYCLTFRFSKNNIGSGDKTCVLYGSPRIAEAQGPNKDGLYYIDGVYFNINAIPKTKSHTSLRKIYSNFDTLAKRKFLALCKLYNILDSTSDFFNVAKKNYFDICSHKAIFDECINLLKENISEGTYIYNNRNWVQLIEVGQELCNDFSTFRPIMMKQLTHFYNKFVEENNLLSTHFNEETFIKNLTEYSILFNEYFKEYIAWMAGEVSIYFDTSYYEDIINREYSTQDLRDCVKTIIEIDNILFNSMIPNRAFLLDPLPEDLLMREYSDVFSSYSLLTGQDEFVKIYHVSKNKYDDLIDWDVVEEFGHNGLLNNILATNSRAWDFGVINTATTSETIFEDGDFRVKDIRDNDNQIDLIEDYFFTDKDNFIKEYSLVDNYSNEEINYVDLNDEINEVLKNTTYIRKFSYASPLFLEIFLPDEKKNNVCGELENYNKIELLCKTTENSDWIELENKESIYRLNFLSTGNQVIGKTIGNDIFVKELDYKNNKIQVSEKLNTTGEFKLTFLCKSEFYPENTREDFYNYRVRLSKNKEADSYSILSHGIDTDEDISNVSILSPVDIAYYREKLSTSLQEQPTYKAYFNRMVKYLYFDDNNNHFVVPSINKLSNDSFVELNAYMKLGEGYIMRQEVLDYIEQYIDDFGRASENTNVGVAINGYTKADQEISYDDSIGSRFITTKDWNSSQPYYIKIGRGCLEEIFNKNEEEQEDGRQTERVSFYNRDYYNGSFYSGENTEDEDSGILKHFYDIDDPVFTVQLGEYEVFNKFKFNEQSDDLITNIQFSVIKRQLDLIKQQQVAIINNDFFELNSIEKFKSQYSKILINDEYVILNDYENSKNFIYLGEWIPTMNNNGEINYPEEPKNKDIINWYSINDDYDLKDLEIRSTNDKIYKGSILLFDDGWKIKENKFAGIYGNTEKLNELFENKTDIDGNQLRIYSKGSKNLSNSSLKARLLYKVLSNCGAFSSIDGINEDFESLISYYNCLKNGEPLVGLPRSVSLNQNFDNSILSKSPNFWFIYTGFDNDDITSELKNKGLIPGNLIGLFYYNETFEVINIKDSIFSYNFDFTNEFVSKDEYNTAIGINCKSREGSILPTEKIESIKSKFDYKITDLVPNSCKANIKIDLGLISKGYEYNEDGSLNRNEQVDVIISKNNLYADDLNKTIYTEYDGKKYGILQKNNKYFKNIINNIVELNKEKTLGNDGIIVKDTLNPVQGFNFDGNLMTLFDRILSVQKVDLRSIPKNTLESNFYSNYKQLEGTIRGFYCEEDEFDPSKLTLDISYKEDKNPQVLINRINQNSKIQKFKPFINNKLYTDENIKLGETVFEDTPLDKQETIDFEVANILAEINTTGLVFYKNLLLTEGVINTADPRNIIIENNNVLSNINVDDTIVDIVPLNNIDEKSYIKISLANNREVKAIGWKNDVFVVACNDFIGVKALTSISELKEDIQYQDDDFIKVDLGLSRFTVTSLSFDDDKQAWIVSLSYDGNFLGTYAFQASKRNDTVDIIDISIVYPEDNTNPLEINEYALVDLPLSEDEVVLTNYGDENSVSLKYSEDGKKARLLARDLSFSDFPEDAITYIDGSFNEEVKQELLEKNSDKIFDSSVNNHLVFSSNSLDEETSYSIPKDSYLRVSFDISQVNGKISMYCSGDSASYEGIEEYWTYDKNLEKWVYGTSEVFKNFISNFSNNAKIEVFFCGTDFASHTKFKEENQGGIELATPPLSDRLGEFLWKLPRTNLDSDKIVVVAVVSDGYSPYIIEERSGTEDSYKVSNFEISAPLQIDQERLLNGEYKLGPYQPEELQNYQQYTANNFNGYEAVVCGRTIFIKSPNNIWVNDDEENSTFSIHKQTEEFFWKKARLPSMHETTYEFFSDKTLEEAYLLVKTQRDLTLSILLEEDGITPRTDFGAGIESLCKWLLKNDVIQILNDEDLPTTIKLEGVQFQYTAQGPRANFDKNKFEKYDCDEEILGYAGVTSMVYFKHQIYLNYLRDYYEIILGCNRSSDFLKEGIKDLRVTDSHIVILTKNDDILSLKLEYTYSREQIENTNNWTVSSLSSRLEIPYLDSNNLSQTPYSYGVDGVFYDTGFKLGNTVKKLYTIESYFINKNIQIFSGYVQCDMSDPVISKIVNQMNVIDSKIPNAEAYESFIEKIPKLSTGETSNKKYPFVCYSTDGGEHFYDYGIHLLGSTDFPFNNALSDWTAKSIIKVGNTINVHIENGEDSHKVIKFAFEQTEGDDIIQQIGSVSDWDGKDFYNAYKPMQFSSGLYCSLLGDLENPSNGFFVETPYKFNNNSSKVTNVGVNFISFDSSETPTDQPFRLRVLVSIDTKNLIEEPTKNIRYLSEYFSQTGELLVRDKIEVDSYTNANRVYSVNECLPLSETSITRLPCLAQDTSGRIYDSDDNGYINMTNSEGQNIYLCDESGNYLLERNPAFLKSSILELSDLIKLSLKYSESFIPMIKIKDDYELVSVNQKLSDFLNNSRVLMSEISYSQENPSIKLEIVEHDDINFDDFEFYEWPLNESGLCEKNIDWLLHQPNSMLEFMQMITERDGSYSQELFDSKYEPKKLKDSNRYFVYDKNKGTILIKEKNLKSNVSLTYTTNEKPSSFVNKPFLLNDNILEKYDNMVINGIYLKEKGYGALVNSTVWKDTLPWENDKDAFEEVLLKNEYGSYVYLYDENANKILMRNALFFNSPSQIRKISYENLSKKDNLVKLRFETYDEAPSTQHVYKLQKFIPQIYYSNNVCLTDITENESLCLLKIYRGAFDIEKEITFKNRFYSDEDKTIEIDAPIYYDRDAKVLVAKSNGTFYAEKDAIEFSIEDIEFSIPCTNIKCPKVISSSHSTFFNDKSNNIMLEFDSNINDIRQVDTNAQLVSINRKKVEFSIKEFKSSIFEYIDENGISYKYNLDVRKITPELYLERDWYNDTFTKEQIRSAVYDGDIECSDLFTMEITNDSIIATSTQNTDLILSAQIFEDTEKTEMLELEKFIFTESSNEIEYSSNKKLLIEGLYGEVILLKPKYDSFELLVKEKSRIIEKELIDFSNQKLEDVSSNKITLNESNVEDGTLLKIKVLPIKNIDLTSDLMNNDDYFTEVSIFDIDEFSYDRVYINNEAFPDSPIEYNGIIYNSENLSDYSIENWKNKDNYSIHLCDSTGHFIKCYTVENNLKYIRIGDALGDCSREIYQDVDVRIIPKKCNYETTFEKFKDLYLDDKIGNNPFVGTIELDQSKKNVVSSYIYQKIGGKFTKVFYDFIKIQKPISFNLENGIINGLDEKEYFDEKNGILESIFTSISEKYRFTRSFNLCGIEYSNPFFENEDYWKLKDNFDSISTHRFLVDSIEDYFNESVNSVLNITEMGIFNKKNQLIAYMHHPKVQYDTKKNHISYNLFVKN